MNLSAAGMLHYKQKCSMYTYVYVLIKWLILFTDCVCVCSCFITQILQTSAVFPQSPSRLRHIFYHSFARSFVQFFCAKKNCLQNFQVVETFHETEQYFNTTYEFCFNKCIHFLFWIVENILCTGNDKHRAHSRSHSHTIIKCHHKAYYLLQKMNKNSAFK